MDSEPLIDEAEGEPEEQRQPQYTNEVKKVNDRLKQTIKPMEEQQEDVDFAGSSKEEVQR